MNFVIVLFSFAFIS